MTAPRAHVKNPATTASFSADLWTRKASRWHSVLSLPLPCYPSTKLRSSESDEQRLFSRRKCSDSKLLCVDRQKYARLRQNLANGRLRNKENGPLSFFGAKREKERKRERGPATRDSWLGPDKKTLQHFHSDRLETTEHYVRSKFFRATISVSKQERKRKKKKKPLTVN